MATKSYTRVNWAGYPSKTTPLSADNLNHMDEGIDNVDTKVTNLESRQDNYDASMTDVKGDILDINDSLNNLQEIEIGTITLTKGNLTTAYSSLERQGNICKLTLVATGTNVPVSSHLATLSFKPRTTQHITIMGVDGNADGYWVSYPAIIDTDGKLIGQLSGGNWTALRFSCTYFL